LRTTMFISISHDPTGTQASANRTVSFTISDGNVSSLSVTRTVTVRPVNDAPVLAGVEAAALQYVENHATIVVSANITVTDVDTITDAKLDTARVAIAAGRRTGDTLAAAVRAGLTQSFSAGTGVLSLSGANLTQGEWQAVLRSVTYESTSEDPTGTQSPANRTVSFVISDGD